MLRKVSLKLIILFSLAQTVLAQVEQAAAIEINLIDSYVTPEPPHKFILSFFTDDSCKSKVIVDKDKEFIVSDFYTDSHRAEIDITGLKFDSAEVRFRILVYDRSNNEFQSEIYDLILPFHDESLPGSSSSFFTLCCIGGIIFGMPSPGIVISKDKNYFTLSKEIPLYSFYGIGYNYPISYIGFEYSYVFNAPVKSYLRLGYKYLFQPGVIEYISAGLDVTSNFKGFNALSPELSIGLFRLFNVFTVSARYRYNYQPEKAERNFHEVHLYLYSNFFSFNF